MDDLEVLRAARARIADPTNWCQGAFARTDEGYTVWVSSDEATRWCAVGALMAEIPPGDADITARQSARLLKDARERLLDPASMKLFSTFPSWVNDQLGHDSVLSMYDEAITSLEGAECDESEIPI